MSIGHLNTVYWALRSNQYATALDIPSTAIDLNPSDALMLNNYGLWSVCGLIRGGGFRTDAPIEGLPSLRGEIRPQNATDARHYEKPAAYVTSKRRAEPVCPLLDIVGNATYTDYGQCNRGNRDDQFQSSLHAPIVGEALPCIK